MPKPDLLNSRILILDDLPANVAVLDGMLRAVGYENIVGLTSVDAALGRFDSFEPDLVIVDLHMPGIDGYEVMERMRSRVGSESYLPIMMITADVSDVAKERAFVSGASDFMTKPFSLTECSLRVRNLLETRSQYQALKRQNSVLNTRIHETEEIDRDELRRHLEISRRIDDVLEGNGMVIIYQPIVTLADGAVVGREALSRFHHVPIMPPDQWFRDAATVGRGTELELRAAETALADLPRLDAGEFLAVNLSPAAIRAPRLRSMIDQPERFVIELTEHERVGDYDALLDALRPLRRAGVRLACDDTGSGFAGLNHLVRLEPDIVKLNRELIEGVDHDLVRRALVSSMVSFCDSSGATLVAEGIETTEELDALVALGVRHGQGYIIARPAPLELGTIGQVPAVAR